jgi:catechol O-methyltransferase
MAATQDLGVLPPEAFIPVGPPPGPGQKARARSICGYYEVEGEKLPEEELLEHIVEKVPAGNPKALIDEIDSQAYNVNWFMNIGDDKGEILDNAVKRADPVVCLEIGTYIGYSAIRIAMHLQKPNAHLYTVEYMERNAKIAGEMVKHAGLADKVSPLVGTIQTTLPALKEQGVPKFDFVFIDHHKDFYLKDLKYLQEEGMLKKGTVVVADNVLWPGAPDYLEFVTTSPDFTTEKIMTNLEYSKVHEDMVTISTYVGEE